MSQKQPKKLFPTTQEFEKIKLKEHPKIQIKINRYLIYLERCHIYHQKMKTSNQKSPKVKDSNPFLKNSQF